MRKRVIVICLFNLGCFFVGFSQDTSVHFIENKNQWPAEVDFTARVAGGSMMVKPGSFTYYFLDQQKIERLHEGTHQPYRETSLKKEDDKIGGRKIVVNFLGSNPNIAPKPLNKLATYYNYFLGNDSSKWASKAASYEGVYYSNFYSGIDLKLYGQGEFIEYDFIVAPAADPSQIRLKYAGMQELAVVNNDVRIVSEYVTITEKKPIAFQWIEGKHIDVLCDYSLANGIISFCFPVGYDTCYELVIDPLLIFSTYSGSAADNWGSTATPGERGNLYSSGVTNQFVNSQTGPRLSGNFPATPGAFQTTYGGIYDVAILKYDSIGQHLLYASYLGGSGSESSHSLVVNANHELLILGTTSSSNFPTTAEAIDRSFNGGVAETNVISYTQGSDIFVAKISSDGSQLLASTFLGGSANDGMNPSRNILHPETGLLTANYGDQLRGDVITDIQGNVYISSVTASPNFPVGNSFNTTYRGGATDALVLKLNTDLSQILWGAFLGGSAVDASHTIKLDGANNIFVGGGTASTNFPTTSDSYQATQAGGVDGWIAHITNDGSSVLASSLTGTSAFDQIYFLDLNTQDEVYVYGQTAGNFPVTAGVFHSANGKQFLQKFSTDLKTLSFSTVFGSGRQTPDISPTAFLVNDCNNIYMSGWGGALNAGYWPGSSTLNMPLGSDPYQRTSAGSDFYFMVLTSDATQFLYATYLGGTRSGTHVDGGTSRFDKGGIVYHAVCSGCAATTSNGLPASDFPTTANAWSRTNRSLNCNNAAFKFDLSSLRARIQTNSITLKLPGYNKVCLPDKIVFQNRSTGGQYYEWDFGDGTKAVKPDTSAIIHQYATGGQYTIKLKAIDSGTCVGKDSTTTVVNAYKPQGFAGADQNMCKDATTHLVAGGGTAYAWTDKQGLFTSSLASPLINPEDTTRYFVTIVDVNGCVKKDTVDIRVVPGMDVHFELTQIYDCFERPTVQVTTRSVAKKDEEIFFDFGDGSTSYQSEDLHQYETDGNYTVRIVGVRNSCVYDEKVNLPFFTLFVPNVITPDASPGENDEFKIKYGGQFISDTDFTVALIVYNRWGGKVYENQAYKNNWTGEGLASGVYYYDIQISGETVCKNWVQIIR
jgi:hypothetical protein